MTAKSIHVDFRKWPDRKHWQYSMEYLGEDEHGHWLWSPAGLTADRGEEGPIALPNPTVKLISADWWAANFMVEPDGSTFIYVDIIAPATWSEGLVTMFDLDLDVWANCSTGEIRMLDEDEFLEHQRLLNYPTELIAGAEAAARRVFEAVSAQDEPFGQIGWRWFSEAISRAAQRR
jgi:hypothetical protein